MSEIQTLQVIDSHTGGEPTRIVVDGAPDLGSGSMAERLDVLRSQHDWIRRACVLEPRGNDVIVGALLCEPISAEAAAGVIFFNNVGYLHMCGHGTIGLAVTLAAMGKIGPGSHLIETPVGDVAITLQDDLHDVSINNVPSYRTHKAVELDVPGHGMLHGDIAWGGNWFFLCHDHGLDVTPDMIPELTDLAKRIRQQLDEQHITGDGDGLIDHIELFGPPSDPAVADGRGFTLCPGGAYDRSPCGTGTSATISCLATDGELGEGDIWRQESVIGSVFEASYKRIDARQISPTITGKAFVTAESKFIIDPSDPMGLGLGG